jgi:small subunit ribosomal protein S1
MLVEGRVTGVIKGGLEVDLKGIRAFMPGSQVDIAPMKDISLLLNQNVKCEVIELDRRTKSVLVSRRKALERELAESREKLKAELAVGQIRSGVVRGITDFGAFVDLGGVDGLIHIREMSWGTVQKVSDVVTPGQRVEVMILKIDPKKDRISLGLKQVQPDPWGQAPDRYPVGTRLKARVVRIADFGAFAELEPGVDGLIPVSEMSWSRIKSVTEAVSVGSVVDCVVIRVEPEKRRIALSMKQAQADPWAGVLDSFQPNSVVKGKVTRLADFGAFVEIAPSVEGLVHISELSDKRVKSCSEVVQPGQEVEARVLGVDSQNRRISLSLKAVHAPTPAEVQTALAAQAAPARVEKKRKKPLRGGLASHFEW